MYRIIGGDGKEYGPIGVEEVRRWVAEGRLNAQSLARPEEAAEGWRPLGSFPEFAEVLRAQEAAQILAATGQRLPPANLAAWRTEILARPAQVRMGHCLAGAWNLWVSNFGLLTGAALVYWLIQATCAYLQIINVVYWVFDGVFYGGLCLVYLKRIRGQAASVGDVFSGFSIAFVHLLLAGLLSGLLTAIGALCCLILPGIYLWVAWSFSVPLVIDKRLEFWTAMELSRRIATRVWFELFVILVIPMLLVIGFHLFELVTKLVALWPEFLAAAKSGQPDPGRFNEIFQRAAQTSPSFELARQLVGLLFLPFAIGAKLYAYEDLFGARSAPKA
jgi:hypothetical protein